MTNYSVKSRDLKAECAQHMAENGLPITEPIIADDKIHRYSADNKKNERDEWYIAHEGISTKGNPYLVCSYGSWSAGSKHEFKSFNQSNPFDEHEQKELHTWVKRKKEEAENQLKDAQNDAAAVATIIWQKSADTPLYDECLDYAKAKGITPGKIKYGTNPNGFPAIIIDIRNTANEIRSLQFISMGSDNKSYKTFLSEGEKRGNFHIIGEALDGAPIYLVEGYATGASVYAATNMATVVAFDAGNIDPVVENIKKKFPNSAITIAGDADEIGRKKASEAAKKFGCRIAFPEFPEDKKKDHTGKDYKDFNDLHQMCGLNEVHEQLQKAVPIITAQDELRALADTLTEKEDPCAYFNVSDLPEPLRDYIATLCQTTDAHPIMITCSVLATVSGFLGTRVYIPKGSYYQTLYPNLWLLCVAKSGQHKTTSLNNGGEIAFEKQAQIFDVIKFLESELKETDDQARRSELMQAILNESLKSVILPTRTSVEGLIQHLAKGHQGIIFASEFGAWLQNLAKNHNTDLKGILTDFFDVPTSWRNLTKTQGDDIVCRPYLSICGVSTLAWLRGNLDPTDVATGFFARFLIFAPPHFDSIPSGLPKPTQMAQQTAKDNFKNVLDTILQAIGQERRLILSEDAQIVFDNPVDNKGLHQKIYVIAKSYDDKCQEILAPYLKRWSPYLLKLAIIMQLFDDPESTEIEPKALLAALSILVPAIKSTAFLWASELGESEHQRKCRIVLEWICQKVKDTGNPIKRQSILASKKLAGGVTEYDYVLSSLVEQGKLKYDEQKPKNESLYSPKENS